MQVKHGSEFLKFTILAASFIAGTSLATAQQSAPVPSTPLQTYTASDQSASVGVPAGWNVTKAGYALIQMSGPKGESVSLGNTLLIHNGPYRPGQNPMTIPNQATLTQKVEAVWQEAAAASGFQGARVSVSSAKPVPLGNIAQCGIFLGTLTNAQGPQNFETRFCSLPMDSNGVYKLFFMNATIPAALAAQERATAEAILSSYKPSLPSLKAILMPSTPPLPPMGWLAPAGYPGGSSAAYAEQMAQESSDCMDEGVIREEPEEDLPPYCR
ncbi:MAG: hypothetical protein ACLPLZ_13585 [Terracidiphilus sp.]